MVHWIKTHKLAVFLLLAVGFLLFKDFFQGRYGPRGVPKPTFEYALTAKGPSPVPMAESTAPAGQRWVIQESNLSLLVKDVRKVGEEIIAYAKKAGGYMVHASYNQPEEQPFATIAVRVSTPQLEEALKFFRSLGVKVINENLAGTDVTDQYVDMEARLTTLKNAKAKLEKIFAQANKVKDILDAQVEILNVQERIDNLIGRRKALEEGAKLTKITLYLSTDEMALPYVSHEAFRPAIIFKLAVRSLVSIFRLIGKMLIWIGVYSAIWVPALVGYFFYRRWRPKR